MFLIDSCDWVLQIFVYIVYLIISTFQFFLQKFSGMENMKYLPENNYILVAFHSRHDAEKVILTLNNTVSCVGILISL